MKTKKIVLGGLAGGVAYFLITWLVYGVLLKDFTTANSNQCYMRPMDDMIWWAMILSNLATGFLLSVIFSWINPTGVMAGAKFAAIIGLLFGLSLDLSFYGGTTMFSSLSIAFVDIFAWTVMTAICGAVVAWVMGMVKK